VTDTDGPLDARLQRELSSEADLLNICVRCERREATMELPNGDYICTDCYADQADRDFDRLSGA